MRIRRVAALSVVAICGIWLALVAIGAVGRVPPPATWPARVQAAAGPNESLAARITSGPYTGLNVSGASEREMTRLAEAMRSFSAADLDIPPLDVRFSTDTATCGGSKGRFSDSSVPWRITICSTEIETVLEHELAHAWERANLSEATRRVFMEENHYTVWRSQDVPWNERAVEGIAVVIQQGVSGLPLPPSLGSDARNRLEAFELLTGQPDPRLSEWVGSREVACVDRPTPLSAEIPDATGRICD